MKLNEIVLLEVDTLADSLVPQVVADNLRLTNKRGGPVAITVRQNQMTFHLADSEGNFDFSDFIQANFGTNGKWKIKTASGVAKTRATVRKQISDEEMVDIVNGFFDKAKKVK